MPGGWRKLIDRLHLLDKIEQPQQHLRHCDGVPHVTTMLRRFLDRSVES